MRWAGHLAYMGESRCGDEPSGSKKCREFLD